MMLMVKHFFILVGLTLGSHLTIGSLARAATLSFYPSRVAFNVAEPGLPVQSFDSANLNGQPYVTQANPLTRNTHNAVFAKGGILQGLKLSTLQPGDPKTAMLVYGGGPVGAISVGDNWFGDTLVLSFSPGVVAVGEDVFANTSSGPSFAGKISEEVFHGTKSLGSQTLTEAAGGSVFMGVSSTAKLPITSVRITWTSDNDATTYVSNIAFGAP